LIATGFSQYIETLKGFKPDLIILDIKNGGLGEDLGAQAGRREYEDIRENHFCPIIFYSAFPELAEEIMHPLIAKVKKGSSKSDLDAQIDYFSPIVEEIHNIYKKIEQIAQTAIKETLPEMIRDSAAGVPKIVNNLIRRRIAALMDITEDGIPDPNPWEQYIIPPMGKYLKLGDVIRKRNIENME